MDDFLEKLKKDRDAVKAKEAAEYDAKIRQRNEYAGKRGQANAAPSAGERIGKTVTGAAKGSAAGYVNAGGVAVEGMNKVGTYLQSKKDTQQSEQDLELLAKYERDLKSALAAGDEKAAKTAQLRINAAQNRLKTNGEMTEYYKSVGDTTAKSIYDTADALAESSQRDISRAKQGAGKVGQFAVDVGVAGTQMAGDMGLALLTGGSALVPMAARSFGSGAQEARQAGASYGQQMAYGAGSAALSVATEKIANVAAPFKKAFGNGVLEKAIPGVVQKLSGSAAGKAALSMLSEGGEEMVEDLLQPILQRATYDPEALVNYKNADYWKNMLYDGLVGAVLGGVGAGVEQIGNRAAGNRPVSQNTPAGDMPAYAEGNSMGAAENAAQGVYGGVMEREAQRLFGNNNPPAQGTGYAATEMGRPDAHLGVSATYEDTQTATPTTLSETLWMQGYGTKDKPGWGEVYGTAQEAFNDALEIIDKELADKFSKAVDESAEGVNLQENFRLINTMVHAAELVRSYDVSPVAAATVVSNAYRNNALDSLRDRRSTLNENALNQMRAIDNSRTAGNDGLGNANAGTVNSGKSVTLDDLLFGGKRVDQSTLTQEQFDAAVSANEQGTVGMDASGKVFQVDPEQHIDRRTTDSVSSRGMNAFQFDHPELHSYYRQAAEALIADADLSLQFPMNRSYERTMQGNKVNQSAQASAHLRQAMDETGLSRAEIIDAAQRIVNDHGQENVKAAKQVEIILDAMLTNGWSTMMGDTVGPNQAYIDAKSSIAGSQPAMQSGEELPMMDDGLGAANAGSLNSDYERLQAQSDTFHPEGAYAARPVDVPTTDFDGRNIPKSSSTVMGGQATDAATVQMLEQQIANGELSFDTIHDTDTVARAQATMREKGFDGALEQYRQAVRTNTATKDNTALGQQLLIHAMRSGDTASTAELLALYTRNSTTAAQAMQAQSIFRKLSPEGQLLAVQKAVSDLNAKYGTDVQLDDGDVADFLNAESDEARQEVTRRIVKKAAQSVPGTFRAKYDTLRYLAMLGNPRTHIRNILGNTFFQVPVSVKNRVGAVVEAAASAVTGGKVERTKSIFGANPFGKLAAECRADWTNAKDFLGQSSKYIEGQTSLFNIEQEADAFSNGNLLGRGINKAADLNSRALEAEDTAAKKWIYTQSLAGYLKANGCKSISDADTALLNRARSYAAEEALRNTFNDRNAASDAVSKLGRAIRSDNPFEKFGGYIVEGVMPFKRTPTNIAVRAVEYSPIGAVLGAVETVRGAKSGDMAQVSKGLDRLAAGVSGTALLAAGFLAAGAGYVTGGEDEDEKQQGFNDLTGHQSYAFETKNGTSVTLDWLAPEAIPFFVGVELYNQGLEGGVSFDDMWDAVKNASAPMLEMSMLQGLNDTFENAAYAKNRGDSVLGSVVSSALTNYATQIFPTIGGQMERSSEEQRMTTYTDKNGKLPTDLQYAIGKVSQKIPGWDYQQIPYIDAWGRTEESGDVLVRSINNLFNPAYVSQVDVDKVESELQRLADATGDGGVFPARAARYFDVNGKRKDLTADEYQKYAKTLGNTSYQLVKEGTGSAAYRSMSDSEKAAYIDRLYDYADQTAKASISAYKMETWVQNAKSAKQDIGVSPAEYMALYEKYGSSVMSGKSYEKVKQAVSAGLSVDEYVQMKRGADLNGNGSVTKGEAEKALSGAKNRVDLWDLICTTSAKNPYK